MHLTPTLTLTSVTKPSTSPAIVTPILHLSTPSLLPYSRSSSVVFRSNERESGPPCFPANDDARVFPSRCPATLSATPRPPLCCNRRYCCSTGGQPLDAPVEQSRRDEDCALLVSCALSIERLTRRVVLTEESQGTCHEGTSHTRLVSLDVASLRRLIQYTLNSGLSSWPVSQTSHVQPRSSP